MGALNLSSKEELGDGQTFVWGPYPPLTAAIFLLGSQVGPFPTLP